MALVPISFSISFAIIFVYYKISKYYSLGRWTLCHDLVKFVYPSNEELKKLTGPPAKSAKSQSKKEKRKKTHDYEVFMVEKKANFTLASYPVLLCDVEQFEFYSEYRVLVDSSVAVFLAYILTELFYFCFTWFEDLNVALLLLALLLWYATSQLVYLSQLFFESEKLRGERLLCISSGLLFALFSMIVLFIDESVCEFGLNAAYKDIVGRTTYMMGEEELGFNSSVAELMIKLFLSLWSGIIGAILIVPTIRSCQMHSGVVNMFDDKPIHKTILNINFSSLIIVILWIKPLSKDLLTGSLEHAPIMSIETFESLRIYLVLASIMLEFWYTQAYFQGYLNLANEKVKKLKKEAGRITNIDLQKKVIQVYYYFCVAALQYVTPLILSLITVLLYKTLGDFSWTGILYNSRTFGPVEYATFSYSFGSLKKLYSPVFYRGIFGYMIWSMYIVKFICKCVGYLSFNVWDV